MSLGTPENSAVQKLSIFDDDYYYYYYSLGAKYLFHSFTCLPVVSSTDEGDPEDDVMNPSPYRDNQINPTQAPSGFLSSIVPSDNTTVGA